MSDKKDKNKVSDNELNVAKTAHKGAMLVSAFINVAPRGFVDGWKAASKYKKRLKGRNE